MDFPDPASLMELPDSASLGPLGPLLRQLASFVELETTYIRDLRQQLEDSYLSLKHLSKAEDPSFTARWWMKEVRDLCHEIKDYLDEAVSWDIAASEGLKGFTARLKDLSIRGTSLQGFNKVATTDDVTLQLPAAPTEEDIVKLLAFGDKKAKQLRVVTLFGFAGAVNTTAARNLYVKYGGTFQCRAFVRVSKNPDMRNLFTSILSQIKAPPGDAFSDVSGLIQSINNHLRHKRYLIVIDDLWTTPEMNFIMGAFPGGYCHSRIITTTQTKDVALANCDSYLQNICEMTPLNDEQSGGNPTPEGMKEELNHIYNKLSPELKTCLLYINMYAAGSMIRKDELVKQWIAESFLSTEKWDLSSPRKKKKENMHHIKKSAGVYFDELVSRKLIQPLERNCNDDVMSCTVEHMVLDMIANKSKEVNFITSVNNYSETTGPPDEARRLSVQFRGEVNAKIPQNIILSKLRSLVFSGFYGCVPSFVECKFLQVFILHIWADRGDATLDLSGISLLLLLRYVKIACNVAVKLPEKIGGLKHLETLEVDARMVTVPSDITSLPGLLNLSLPSANLPDGVTVMTSICTLGCFDLSRNSEENMKKLLELVNLEDLHLTCSDANILQNKMDVLWCSIFWPHRSLRSVDLVPTESYTDDAGASRMISISCESFSHNNVSPGAASASTTGSVLERLESCKLLRVLDLEGCKGIDDAVLDAVCQFLILKYLSLRGSDVRRIPRKIRRLQYLETLDLRETEVEKLPIEVIKLPWLAHLFGKFNLPLELKLRKKNSKLHKFLSERSRLQTLSGFVMDKSSGSESIILDARFLRKVKVWFKGYSTFLSQDQLVSSLNTRFSGSSALESLSIVLNDYAPGFLHCLEAPCMLRSIKLSAKLGKLPNFITSPETTLRELELSSTGLSSQELSLLQKLPCLLYLKLYEDRWGFGSDDFHVDSHGFLSLERLCFEAPTIPQLHIEEGAMNKLASLYLLCPEYPPSRVEGLQYLLHLNEVVLHDSLEDSELSDWNMTAMLLENRPRVTKQAPSS